MSNMELIVGIWASLLTGVMAMIIILNSVFSGILVWVSGRLLLGIEKCTYTGSVGIVLLSSCLSFASFLPALYLGYSYGYVYFFLCINAVYVFAWLLISKVAWQRSLLDVCLANLPIVGTVLTYTTYNLMNNPILSEIDNSLESKLPMHYFTLALFAATWILSLILRGGASNTSTKETSSYKPSVWINFDLEPMFKITLALLGIALIFILAFLVTTIVGIDLLQVLA